MRDLLPGEAASQEALVGAVLGTFELHGFQQVGLPAFEYTEVLERGLGAIPPSSMLRFVEPDTGEVVALRPDMTPQVARLVATRLSEDLFPARLSYRGSVLRRRHERARHDQEVLQAGIELVGLGGLDADLEVLRATISAVRAAGLADFVLDLGHGALAPAVLSSVAESLRPGLLEALSLKDQAELVRRAERSGIDAATVRELSLLVELHGDASVFDRGRRGLAARAHGALGELEALYRRLAEAGLSTQIVVDLGETRAVAYYTGPMFQILAEGPGQAVASGGRYDGLLAAFQLDRPAAGAAIHIDHLRWALGQLTVLEPVRALVVAAPAAPAGVDAALDALRAAQIPSVVAESDSALDYARAWRYSHVVRLSEDDSVRLVRVEAASEKDLGVTTLARAIELMRG